MLILQGHGGTIRHLAYTPDGRSLVSAGDQAICLWNLQTGRKQRGLQVKTGRHGGLAISPDGQHAVIGQPFDPQQQTVGDLVDVYHLGNAELVVSLGPGLRSQRHLLFWDNSSLLIGSHVGTQEALLSVWNLAAGSRQQTLPGYGYGLALSPDGSLLASGGVHPSVQVWERRPPAVGSHSDRWSPLRSLRGLTRLVSGLTFCSAGRSLMAITDSLGDEPCEVRHWDIETGEEISVLPGPPGPLLSKAISPDAAVLAWTGADETLIHLWDLQRGRALEPLDWGLGPLHALAFAPDSSTAAAAGQDARIVVWDLDLFDR